MQERITADLSRLLGHPIDRIGELRRVDLSGELHFARGEDGRALLRVLDGLHSARYKTAPVREQGGPGLETVYWRTPSRNAPVLRAYDKGIESGTAAPGERIRIERQLRYTTAKRPSLSQFLSTDLAEAYTAPVGRWLSREFAAGTADQLLELLTEAAVIWPSYWASGSSWCSATGRLWQSLWPVRKAERVAGTLAISAHYGRAWAPWSVKQRQRRMAEIRELGLLLLDEPIHIDAHALVSGLCEEWRHAA